MRDTALHMIELTREFIIFFEWLYPGHQLLLNVDWSSNHNAIAKDALTPSNLLVGWGDKNAHKIKAKTIEVGCINPKCSEIPEE